jgi:hypothetical protein
MIDERKILAHVKHGFGWHGGMDDPPPDDALLSAIRGTLEWLIAAGLIEEPATWPPREAAR